MARICNRCKYYDPGGEQTSCPACETPLQFTLLPPPGQAPAPLPGLPEPETSVRVRRPERSESKQIGEMLGWVFRQRRLLSLVAVPIVVILGAVFGLSSSSLKSKYDQVQIGMSANEVRRIMEPPVRSRRFPVRRFSMFDNFPESGPARLTWEENGATVVLDFMDGEVVNKSQKGLK